MKKASYKDRIGRIDWSSLGCEMAASPTPFIRGTNPTSLLNTLLRSSNFLEDYDNGKVVCEEKEVNDIRSGLEQCLATLEHELGLVAAGNGN